ncbi:hypothetical protein BH20ACI4_BH20ACI4_23920 [soil metagenome]
MKKIISTLTIILLLNFAFATNIFAKNKDAEFAEKVKTKITKLGIGQDARVKIKLKDGSKIKGYISEIGDNQFVVTNTETGQNTVVPYSGAKQVKGNNLSTGVKIAIGLGILLAVVLIADSALK